MHDLKHVLFILSKETYRAFHLNLLNIKFTTPICPLVFENANIEELKISNMVNSYYKKNVFRLINYTASEPRSLNTNIRVLWLEQFYGIELDTTLLNSEIFQKTDFFSFQGVIKSIQPNLFENLRNFRLLLIDQDNLLDLTRSQGIEWIKKINYKIKANLSDPQSFTSLKRLQKTINIKNINKFQSLEKVKIHIFVFLIFLNLILM